MRVALDAPIRTTAAALERILATGFPSLVVFETPGCGPCLSLRPALDELARDFENRILIVRVTDASEGWLAARHHLSFVPTLLFWRDGVEHGRIKGNPGPTILRAHMECLLSGEHPPEPAEGPRHILEARFGASAPGRTVRRPRALLMSGAAMGTPYSSQLR